MLKNKRHYEAGSKSNGPKFSFMITVFWNSVKSSLTYRLHVTEKCYKMGREMINKNCTLQGMWYIYEHQIKM